MLFRSSLLPEASNSSADNDEEAEKDKKRKDKDRDKDKDKKDKDKDKDRDKEKVMQPVAPVQVAPNKPFNAETAPVPAGTTPSVGSNTVPLPEN